MPLADSPGAGAVELPPLLVAAPPIRCCAHTMQIPPARPLYISSLSLRIFVSLACTSQNSHPVTCTAWRRQVVTEQAAAQQTALQQSAARAPLFVLATVRMSAAQPAIADELRHINHLRESHHIESNGRVVLEWQSIRGFNPTGGSLCTQVRSTCKRKGRNGTHTRGTARSADETWMEKFGALGKI